MTLELFLTLTDSIYSNATEWFAVPNVEQFVDEYADIIQFNIDAVTQRYHPQNLGYIHSKVTAIK